MSTERLAKQREGKAWGPSSRRERCNNKLEENVGETSIDYTYKANEKGHNAAI